ALLTVVQGYKCWYYIIYTNATCKCYNLRREKSVLSCTACKYSRVTIQRNQQTCRRIWSTLKEGDMVNLRFLQACILTSMALAASTALPTSVSAQTADPAAAAAAAAVTPRDPGLRGGAPGAGGHLPGLTTTNADGSAGGEVAFFELGQEDFGDAEGVADGLGPRFNLDACGGCHAQPAVGGTSPAVNPQAAIPNTYKGNVLPSFIRADGPVREARFVKNPDGTPDGGVHGLFVITGGPGATGCNIKQE